MTRMTKGRSLRILKTQLSFVVAVTKRSAKCLPPNEGLVNGALENDHQRKSSIFVSRRMSCLPFVPQVTVGKRGWMVRFAIGSSAMRQGRSRRAGLAKKPDLRDAAARRRSGISACRHTARQYANTPIRYAAVASGKRIRICVQGTDMRLGETQLNACLIHAHQPCRARRRRRRLEARQLRRRGTGVLGCRHRLEFPVVKLIEFADRLDHLETDPNPFALVTAAHLRTRQTRQDPEARYQAKRGLVRLLYRRGWDRQRILDLFAVLDWMMRLPDVLERKLWQDIEQIEGETRMRYVTSVERLAIERGIQQGKLEGKLEGEREGKLKGEAMVLERLLAKRFGPLADETRGRLRSASAEQLELWAERILDAPTLAAVLEDH